jgi:hypothetical protein
MSALLFVGGPIDGAVRATPPGMHTIQAAWNPRPMLVQPPEQGRLAGKYVTYRRRAFGHNGAAYWVWVDGDDSTNRVMESMRCIAVMATFSGRTA